PPADPQAREPAAQGHRGVGRQRDPRRRACAGAAQQGGAGGPFPMKWFLGTLLILLAALLLESGLLAYAMYVLLGLLVLSRLLARSWIDNLSAARRCNKPTAEVGQSLAVNVRVHNHSLLPVPWVLMEDVLPVKNRGLVEAKLRVRVKQKRMRIAMLRSYGETTLLYQIEFKM